MSAESSPVSRRKMLRAAGGLLAAATLPPTSLAFPAPPSQAPTAAPAKPKSDITGALARYMAGARTQALPPDVAQAGKQRILDTLAAMISGTRLKPGEMATRYVRALGGAAESCVIASNVVTNAINAALANGMFGHADETDDVELVTKTHPGCSAVSAALAMAEREGRSGREMLNAVVLGYDICCRFLMALGSDLVRETHRSAEGLGATFCGTAAAASLANLDETGMRYVLSYAAQQASGLWSWIDDNDHIEKAFDFAGMGARNGVMAATMVQAGFTGVRDIFDCEHNVLIALSSERRPEEMVAKLGKRFFVTESAIKTYSVGYPIQSALAAFLKLRSEHALRPGDVDRIVVSLPQDGASVVDNSAMPDVNIQYIMAVALLDGAVSFANSHSRERMNDPQVLAIKNRVQLKGDKKLNDPAAPRSALVEASMRNGLTVRQFVRFAPGTKENPVDTQTLVAKARDLMTPVLGKDKTEQLIQRVNNLESVQNMRELRPFLTLPG